MLSSASGCSPVVRTIGGAGGSGGHATTSHAGPGGGAVCGNGILEGSEACDDGNTMNGDGCSSSCMIEPGWVCAGTPSKCATVCGDGIVVGPEVCDPGNLDGGVVDGDASSAPDGTDLEGGPGPEAGPPDDGGGVDDAGFAIADAGSVWLEGGAPISYGGGVECASDCRSGVRVFFADDVEHGESGWLHEHLFGPVPDTWSISTQQASSPAHSWSSGPDGPTYGDAMLISPAIDLTNAKPGVPVTLSFQHWYFFDECMNQVPPPPDFTADGARVEVMGSLDAGMFAPITPTDGDGGYPEQNAGNGCENPLDGGPGYSRDSAMMFVPATFDLTPYIGQVVEIGFHVGWDCGNCMIEPGWYIDDVKVTQPL
jgi:cysteine-rich repeat protein